MFYAAGGRPHFGATSRIASHAWERRLLAAVPVRERGLSEYVQTVAYSKGKVLEQKALSSKSGNMAAGSEGPRLAGRTGERVTVVIGLVTGFRSSWRTEASTRTCIQHYCRIARTGEACAANRSALRREVSRCPRWFPPGDVSPIGGTGSMHNLIGSTEVVGSDEAERQASNHSPLYSLYAY
jgi:hypothetical protein